VRGAAALLVGALCCTVACLPKEDSREYACTTSAMCANNWECVDRVCRQSCMGAGDCTTPGWSDTPFECLQNHCVPTPAAGSSSGSGSSSGAASSSGGSNNSSSGGGSSSSGGGSSSSSSGGSSGALYKHSIFTVTGGGGAAHGNMYELQLSVGQPVAGPKVNNAEHSLSTGLFSTVEVP